VNTKRLRTIIPLAVIGVIAVGFATHVGVGTLSAIGWQDISLLCPLGALMTMIATKTMIPRAVVSVVIAIALILLLARAFCGWICPVPVVSKIRGVFSKKTSNTDMTGTGVLPAHENPLVKATVAVKSTNGSAEGAVEAVHEAAPLTAEEERALKGCAGGCSSCAEKRARLDSRHVILGGSLVSAAVFGFPVFCLICPIGLTFATIVLVMRLFAFGDVAWGVILVPALLAAEVVFFRKWCSTFCPISAFMSLLGKANRTFVPTVDDAKCRESAQGASCEVCAAVCPQGINVRHPEAGMSFSECTKCRACVEACPTRAITMPFLPKKATAPVTVVVEDEDTVAAS
jgi:ferredoxin-type protein NapH